MGMPPPIGPVHEARRKRALADAADEKIEQRLLAIKDQNRPKWAALFKGQREELRAFGIAQQAALPRLFYHLRLREPEQKDRLAGAVKALLGAKDDRKTLERRHEKQRKALAREVSRERRAAVAHEEKAYERDLARLDKELAAQAAAFEKAVAEGHTGARAPDQQAVSGQRPSGKEFQSRVRARIEQAKKREQDRKRGRGRDDGGRERD
jgi:hypothetical protein